MNKLEYYKILLNLDDNNSPWDRISQDITPWINDFLEKKSVYCESRFKNINHPLVKSGDAYWINKNTLCIGYKLKNNNKVYHPILNSYSSFLVKNKCMNDIKTF